jgi:hypothetical protein
MYQVIDGNETINVDSSSVLFWPQTTAVIGDAQFQDPSNSFSFKTRLSIENLYTESKLKKTLVTGPREYQREKVSSLDWKQNLIETVLTDKVAKIPELHQRVVRIGNNTFIYKIEMLDGQQRSTTLIDFRDNKFSLGRVESVLGFDVSGKTYDELPIPVKELFDNYTLYSTMYVNIDNDEARHLFIDVLNNVNDMNAQEKRNAERGVLAAWVRDTARFEDTRHQLFERIPHPKNKGEELMKYFNEKFRVGRMDSDEWLAQLFYLTKKGWTHGVSQSTLTKWYRETNAEGGVYQTPNSPQWAKDVAMMEKLLNQSLQVLGNVPNAHKKQLSNMVALVLCLFYDEMKNLYGKIDTEKFVSKFFQVYDDWSDTKKGLYEGHLQYGDKKALGQFKSLFGGKNGDALKTIRMVLVDFNMDSLDDWGIVQVDSRRNFTRDEIYRKWKDQGCTCYYTGRPIALEDAVGDHGIPWSWGADRGGITSYDNLIVTTEYHNARKSDKYTAEEYISLLQADLGDGVTAP